MATSVINFDKTVYGDDVDDFIPERWLRDANSTAYLDRCNTSFGYGPRICIGKHVSTSPAVYPKIAD